MKLSKRLTALVMGAALTFGLLAGCGNNDSGSSNDPNSNSNSSAPSQGQEVAPNLDKVENDLTMHIEGEVDTTKTLTTLIDCDQTPAFNGNPFDDVAGANWSIQPFLFDYLAFFSPVPERTFKNSLMDSYTYEDQVLTIKLKSGLKWSDGSPLDAEDLMTNYYCDLNYSQVWGYLEKLEKVDDLTVRLTFLRVQPPAAEHRVQQSRAHP